MDFFFVEMLEMLDDDDVVVILFFGKFCCFMFKYDFCVLCYCCNFGLVIFFFILMLCLFVLFIVLLI